jgi:hypothetical protein
MQDSKARRARQMKGAQNQALLREVNERIAEFPSLSEVEILCECEDTACTEPIGLDSAEYEEIRRHPARFPIKPGHDNPEIERIVHEAGDYVVVEKIEFAAEIAERLDPRARG